jgi:HAD superfamily hydrolase (TIGR01509 family)
MVARPQLAIFDCDGVLVDSEVISNTVLARALTQHGLPTTLAQARATYQGMLLEEIDERAASLLGLALPQDWLVHYQRERAEVFRRELQPVAGAREAVAAIAAAGIAVCVASQGRLEKTRLSLELTGLDALFAENARFSAEQVPRGKPHPDLFLHAAAQMGVQPSECVVVEDTPSGVRAAVAARIRVVGYFADSDERALRDAGAEQCIETMSELPRLLGIG